jgi:hypothetical protein
MNYLFPTITHQPVYAEIYRHGIDYRIPLKHNINAVVISDHLNEKYPNLKYDQDRNMIIVVHYLNAFDRFYNLPNDFKDTHLLNYDKWGKMIDMKSISAPILNPDVLKLLYLSSREQNILNELTNDPEIIYTALNDGGWYEFFMGSPTLA